MAIVNTITGDLHVAGNINSRTMSIPAGTVEDDDVKAAAGLAASKLEHQHQKVYAQESSAAAAAEDRVVHVVYGATGSIVGFEAGSVVACVGDSTITIDLHKNGSSILSAAIVLDSTNTAYIVETGAIDTSTLADGDVLEIVITVSAGTGTLGKGLFASVILREDAQ